MPLGNINLQILNHHAQQRFPLTIAATGMDQTETIEIPDNFLVWLDFPISSALAVSPEKFYIQAMLILSAGVTLEIGYDDGSTYPLAATVSIPKSTHTPFRYYTVVGVNQFAGGTGRLAVGFFDTIDTLPSGRFEFSPADSYLEPACFRPVLRGLTGVRIRNGLDESPVYDGDITLTAGENIRFDVTTSGSVTDIRISAISGENLNTDCDCDEVTQGIAIRRINGIGPNSDHNYRILGNDCFSITAVTNGLQIEDTCSKPCCGCEEVERLQSNASRLSDGVATYAQFQKNLAAEVTQMRNSLLGSRLGQDACETCE